MIRRDEISIGNELIKDLGWGSTIVVGIVFTGLAGTLYDFKKAIDQQDEAKKPKLIPEPERQTADGATG